MRDKLLLCTVAIVLAACSAKEETPKQALVVAEGEFVRITEPEKADFLKLAAVHADQGGILRLPGRLVWNEERTVRVFPQVGGRVQNIAVDVGQPVKAGQALAVLGSADYGQAQADARKAQADLHVAEQALARSRELREAGIVAEKDFQAAEADAQRARVESARASRRLAGLGGDGDGSYALTSPLAGIVVERNINPGLEFHPEQGGAPLFVVTDPASLWLQLDASESDLASLKRGLEVDIEIKQYPGERFKGVIRHVADFVDPQSRTIKVRCEVPNKERRLKAEMFAQVLVELPPSGQLRVPAAAVMLQGDQRYVLIEAEAGRYRRQRIDTVSERDGEIEVRAGLKDGDKVVVEGNLNLVKYFRPTADVAK